MFMHFYQNIFTNMGKLIYDEKIENFITNKI